MILPSVPDPRFTTLRRGGGLTDGDHRAVAHVPAHDRGAAAYALKAVEAAHPGRTEACRAEGRVQVVLLPPRLRELVLEDQRNRNSICWNILGVE